ncbi:ribosome alternative rescue factor ArfA [Psychromonas sp. B3M02]|nr:ribosome alternative rescue factor ArfA [Psychromonas sp. B3M02]
MGKKQKMNKMMKSSPGVNLQTQKATEIGRGTINHSAMAALVTSKVFTMRVEKAKKGKGSFSRKAKHMGKESYQIAA